MQRICALLDEQVTCVSVCFTVAFRAWLGGVGILISLRRLGRVTRVCGAVEVATLQHYHLD
jgi:hypothetical protein